MRILVIGQCTLHWGRMEFGNIGNYYVIEPFFSELHKVFPDAEIITTFQMSDAFCKKANIERIPLSCYYSWDEHDLTMAYKELAIAQIYNETNEIIERTQYIDYILSSDIVIDYSGDIWGKNADLVGPNRFLVGLLKDRVAQLFKKATFMIAGSPGPFNKNETLKFAQLVYKNFNLVTNREEISKEVLHEYGFDISKTIDCACPAFEFKASNINDIKHLIKGSFLEKKEKPTIGFIICGWNMIKGPFNRDDWNDEEFSLYVKLLNDLINGLDVNVCIMSHSNGFNLPPNFKLIKGRDFSLVKRVYDILKQTEVKDRIYLFDDIYLPSETKAIIGQFDMLITGRVHAAVASLSQNIPTVIIDYGHEPKAHKLYGFAKIAQVEEYVADPHNYDDMKIKSFKCFNNRLEIANQLKERNKEIKKLIKLNFESLKDIFYKIYK